MISYSVKEWKRYFQAIKSKNPKKWDFFFFAKILFFHILFLIVHCYLLIFCYESCTYSHPRYSSCHKNWNNRRNYRTRYSHRETHYYFFCMRTCAPRVSTWTRENKNHQNICSCSWTRYQEDIFYTRSPPFRPHGQWDISSREMNIWDP